MIYFDNAATTYPKPQSVIRAVSDAVKNLGNPGRGAHTLAMRAADEVYKCRTAAAKMFGAKAENVIFTSGATHSLNLAIGACREQQGSILISDLEHNSVLRPAIASGCEVRIFSSYPELSGAEREGMILVGINALSDNAAILVCTAASNICGIKMPIREIGKFCREHGILFIVDGAQAGGILDIDIVRDNIDVLCLPGHKGLFGPMGCGLMILGENVTLPPFLYGGSGVDSRSQTMPPLPPERYEAGTLPLPLIAGLRAGIEFVRSKSTDSIRAHEQKLARMLKDQLSEDKRIRIYAPQHDGGIVLFSADGKEAEDVAAYLDSHGICTRAGLHCAPLAHDTLGSDGAVRVSFGAMNTEKEVRILCERIRAMK